MGSLSKCPLCNNWLNYDAKLKEFYCSSEDCDYTEYEAWQFKLKFRKDSE